MSTGMPFIHAFPATGSSLDTLSLASRFAFTPGRFLAREITALDFCRQKSALTFLFPPGDCLGPVGELHRLLYDRGISFTVSMD